jgi:hypothetical protein
MNRFVSLFGSLTLAIAALTACGDGSGDDGDLPPLFEPRPECEGAPIVPLMGQHHNVISFLEIGEVEDGFDLDGDGEPDNKLAAVGSLARSAIEDSFDDKEILIPFEFFDFDDPRRGRVRQVRHLPRACTSSMRTGRRRDRHPRRRLQRPRRSDRPGHAGDPGNGKDDDCDGLADETDRSRVTAAS